MSCHGLGKSLIFAVLIAVIGVVNGAGVTGGAEGVGHATTRAVVQAISAIVGNRHGVRVRGDPLT